MHFLTKICQCEIIDVVVHNPMNLKKMKFISYIYTYLYIHFLKLRFVRSHIIYNMKITMVLHLGRTTWHSFCINNKLSSLQTYLDTLYPLHKHVSEKLKCWDSCRDKVIEQERQLRQAAEERLQSHLTDLYNNPEVNRELRERLPRASKSDPLDTSLTVNDNSVEEGSVVDRMEKTKDTPKQRWDGWRQKKK